VRDFLRRTIYNRSWVLDLILLFVLATTIFFLVGQRNQTYQLARIADYNKTINLQNKQVLDQIMSCTDPRGPCYQNNQRVSHDAINNINRIALLAAYCASKTPPYATVAEVRKCVETGIAGKEPIQTK
jgi:hypothetical protein